MCEAWEKKTNYPFCGIPKKLYGDEDGVTKSQAFRDFKADLKFVYDDHAPGSSNAKGKIEGGPIKYLKLTMMSALRAQLGPGKTMTLKEANALLDRVVAEKNARIHRSTGKPPIVAWREGLSEPIRPVPDDFDIERFFHVLRTPIVHPDLTVQIDGVAYQLDRKDIFLALIGQKARVQYHPDPTYRHHLIIHAGGDWQTIKAIPAVPDEAGSFKSLPKTTQEMWIEKAQAADLGDEFDASKAFTPAEVDEDTHPTITPLIPENAPEPTISRRDAAIRLARHGWGDPNALLDGAFAGLDQIPISDFEEKLQSTPPPHRRRQHE